MSTKVRSEVSQQEDRIINGDLTVTGNILGKWASKAQAMLDTVLARLANLAHIPQAAAGVGQFVGLNSGAGAALVLPAGGTWAYFTNGFNAAFQNTGGTAGIAAGGTTIQAAAAGYTWYCFAWRIT